MTTTALSVAAVLVAIFSGIATVYYMYRSSARESERQIVQDRTDAVAAAVRPLNDTILQLRSDNRSMAERINSLEDELRRGRGYGGDDRAGR
jgi:outer membrane murein-binding lipoprotein Lpp